VVGEVMWAPVWSIEELVYYISGRNLRIEYEAGSSNGVGWISPSRVRSVVYDRVAELQRKWTLREKTSLTFCAPQLLDISGCVPHNLKHEENKLFV
jgi:hypothetical protein